MPLARCLHCGEAGNLVARSDDGGVVVWCQTCFFVTDVAAQAARDGHDACYYYFDSDKCLCASFPAAMTELCEICPLRAEVA